MGEKGVTSFLVLKWIDGVSVAGKRLENCDRDLALYLGRQQYGLKLADLDALAGWVEYAVVSNRLCTSEAVHNEDPRLERMKQALRYSEIRKM